MVSSSSLKIEIVESINDIATEDWNACVGPDEPFARHEFLSSLEDSGCVTAETGWLPQHLIIKENNKVKACIPAYLKSHSYGEYVFDWSWAEAYERAGGRYYPKLQCAIPFTPVSGHRILLHPDAGGQHRDAAIDALIERTNSLNLSSLHITFATKDEWEAMKDHGYCLRTGHQYHWENNHYSSFDDFLAQLSSRKRKSIKKERKKISESPVYLQSLSGTEIKEAHWDKFFAFYMDTSGRKWGHPYLNRDFFSLLGERMGKQVVLVLAIDDDRIVGGALNLKGSETLFGRYWGCLEDYKFLHFEACYYQAIEHAINHKLKRVEAGAQGQHKIQRGYLPVPTYSAHWIRNESFRNAVNDFLYHDTLVNTREIKELAALSPYKKQKDETD